MWIAAAAAGGIAAGLLVRRAGAFRAEVAGDSMAPALRAGDWLIATAAGRVSRGDVVVVRHPSRDLELVKRVAGLPGERVGGRSLGPDEYLVVGDNEGASTDGRAFGPVRREAIVGVARLRYWPRPRLL